MRPSYLAILLLVVGCSDANVRTTEEAPLPLPIIVVEPTEIETAGFCAESAHELVISSVGQTELEIQELRMEGEGWSVGTFELPALIPTGETSVIPLVATGGEARLTVVSTDPNRHETTVILESTRNLPPTVTLLRPEEGDVIFTEELLCMGLVQDTEDDDSSLTVQWSASPSSWTNSDPPDTDGMVEALWTGITTPEDEHAVYEVSLSATDSCGETTSVTHGLCRGTENVFQSVDPSSWEFVGSAAWDLENNWLQLTEQDISEQVGSAFETGVMVPGGAVEIDFRFYIGGGSGADGFSLTALDIDRIDTDGDGAPNFLGGAGCAMGFGGNSKCTATFDGVDVGPPLPGWSIEVDTYYNPEDGVDPTAEDHVGFYFDGNLLALETWSALPEVEDSGGVDEEDWHTMSVLVGEEAGQPGRRVRVTIDEIVYIDEVLDGHFDFPAYVGFTAGTGGATNLHLIDGLTVTESTCD